MKRVLFIAMLILCGMLRMSAQDVITIQMKDGNTVEVSKTAVQRMDYTTDVAGASMLMDETFTAECPAKYDLPQNYEDSMDSVMFFTFTMSDELRSAFTGFDNIKLTNKATGQWYSCIGGSLYYPNFPSFEGSYYYHLVTLDGYVHPYLSQGTGGPTTFDAKVRYLAGFEPVAQTIEAELTARFKIGGMAWTKKAVCQFTYTPGYLPVEDAYYATGTFNDWQLTPLVHAGSNKYDGWPFTLTFKAPKKNGERTDCEFYIVPVSAVNGNSYDQAKILGVIDSTANVYQDTNSNPVTTYYNWNMAMGEGIAKLEATDGADIYILSYYPSYNQMSIKTEQTDGFLDRCYACLGFSNPQRSGNYGGDIPNLDAGSISLPRLLVNLNDITTDELLCCWGDPGTPDLNFNNWNAATPQILGAYARLQKGVEYCNQYLDYTDGDAQQRAEVRFLRAYYNYHLLDLFGNVPLYRSAADVNPDMVTRQELFAYIEQELKACVDEMPQPHVRNASDADNYGRVDQVAAWMLLARLYLNAEAYTGMARWADAAEYARKVVDSPYSLYTTSKNGWSAYQQLFMGDNGENGAACEAIMAIPYDGLTATDYGQMFMIAAPLNSDVWATDGGDFGTTQYWGGIFARPNLVAKFFPNGNAPTETTASIIKAAGDDRALLWGQNRQADAANPSDYYSGFAPVKYSNRYTDGGMPHASDFADTDLFPMRYAEALLTLGEAQLRMGNAADAATYINMVRTRAHAVNKADFTLSDVIDEWTREFYMEGRHRTDLVRFGLYGGDNDYQWRWKGGTYRGTSFLEYKNIFPLPQTALDSNPNAIQNPGY